MSNSIANKAKNPYLIMALCLYVIYMVHGMGVITITQNKAGLMAKFLTDESGIATLVSGIGLGRLITLFICGPISDKFGRRPMFYVGGVTYVLFFLGIIFSPNLQIAFIFAVCAGAANSCLDTCAYPALMEAFPKTASTAVILLKAVISIGQMIFPFFVSFSLKNDIWFGCAILIPAILTALSLVVISFQPFPKNTSQAPQDASLVGEIPTLKGKASVWIEGAACVCFAFTSFAAFYIVAQWMPSYAKTVAGMDPASAGLMTSAYAFGSLLSVFVTAMLIKSLIRPVLLMMVFSFLAGVMALLVYLFPSPTMCTVGSAVIGFTAAGGIFQLGVALMSEFFWRKKATVTSIFMLASSLSNTVIPMAVGALMKMDVKYVMLFDAGMGFAGAALSFLLLVRYYKLFNIPEKDVRLGEKLCNR